MDQLKLQLTGANFDGSRRKLDFYPTPPACTIALLDFLALHPTTKIWEPACGDGQISKICEEWGFKTYSSDIQEVCYGKGGVDFLKTECVPSGGIDAIITNPPFNLSMEFISKSLEMAPTVAMLLKCQYWHAKKRMSFFEETPPAWVLPLTWRPDFLNGEKGGSPTMEVCWTVWQKGHRYTKYKPLKKP